MKFPLKKLSTAEILRTINYEGFGIKIEGEILRKCQKVMLGITEDFISMCEKEGIWYELCGGTLLGAVRHKGFVPWDDDVDLMVLSKDFEKLRDLAAKYYGDKYTFVDYKTPRFQWPMGRLMLNNTVFMDRNHYDSEHHGFFIDVLIVENVPDNSFLRRLHGIFSMIIGGLNSCRKFYENRALYRKWAEKNPQLRTIARVKTFIGWCISFMPLQTWANITRAVYGLCKNDNSKYINIPCGRKLYFGDMYLREWMIPTVPLEFEGHQWQCPKEYKLYLAELYGPDYMTPLPPEKREHHVIMELKFPDGTTK